MADKNKILDQIYRTNGKQAQALQQFGQNPPHDDSKDDHVVDHMVNGFVGDVRKCGLPCASETGCCQTR